MAEYISREAVIDLSYYHGIQATYDNPMPDGVDAVDVIDIEKIPAADVVESRHGVWEQIDVQPYFRKHYSSGNKACSICHRKGMKDWNYCPNCGAKMDGGAE